MFDLRIVCVCAASKSRSIRIWWMVPSKYRKRKHQARDIDVSASISEISLRFSQMNLKKTFLVHFQHRETMADLYNRYLQIFEWCQLINIIFFQIFFIFCLNSPESETIFYFFDFWIQPHERFNISGTFPASKNDGRKVFFDIFRTILSEH